MPASDAVGVGVLDCLAMKGWLSLVPGALPCRCLHVEVAPDALARALAGFDLAPFEACPPSPTARPGARVYADAAAAAAWRAGQNHFGAYAWLTLVGGSLEIELLYAPEAFPAEVATATRLLARLLEVGSPTWTAFSRDLDSGQSSALVTGDAAALARVLG